MIFSTTEYKNGKKWGRMEFNTGKVVILKPKELAELEDKIKKDHECSENTTVKNLT